MQKLVTMFARQKFMLMRGNGVCNAPIIIFLFSAQIQQFLVKYGWNVSVWYLFPASMVLLWLIGLVEVKIGVMKAESQLIWENTPKNAARNALGLDK